jgi:glycosyltransferase involved in cell wall biosynthesis
MIRTIADVLRGEGLPSAVRRASERLTEFVASSALRAGALLVSAPGNSPILNVASGLVVTRHGGVQTQLSSRLKEERKLRPVALLQPGLLDLSVPHHHTHSFQRFSPAKTFDSPEFEAAVQNALSITGARAIQLEGLDGVPLGSVLRLMEKGIAVILSVHDFSLFSARPNLLEEPSQRFCHYSLDHQRCRRCIGETWDVPGDHQSERRRLGHALLETATRVIFPSHFLFEKHRELFSLSSLRASVIEPGVPAEAPPPRASATEVAYAGSVKIHKGAHLLPEIIRQSKEGSRVHVFGGGDEQLFRQLRSSGNVTIHGYYRHGQLPVLLSRHRIGLVILPSIVPESYSLVMTEAHRAGAAVVAFDLGAPAERIRTGGGGWLAPLESGATGLAEIVRQWRDHRLSTTIPRSVFTPSDAAAAHVELYRELGFAE